MKRPTKKTTRAAGKALRRSRLIDATIECIARHGLAATTLSRVAKLAGLSHGIVNFHFRSKDLLLIEALRYLSEEYRNLWQRALDEAGDSAARALYAMVHIDLDPAVCNRKKISVWYAFYGEVKARPTCQRLCEEADREQFATMCKLVERLIEEGTYPTLQAERIATGLTAMTDGLWLDCLLGPRDFDRDEARETVHAYLDRLFPKHFPLNRPSANESSVSP
jgi:TetR/AcrR family transcriptional repressor of bet genes